VLLEIFDFYRQGIYSYDREWKKSNVWWWTCLAHVCRKWRAVMLASPLRLDFAITVGPTRPDNIETILSGTLPIRIRYKIGPWRFRTPSGSPLWRLRDTLKHHDRVREISFEVLGAWWDEFFKETNRPFPALETLVLRFGQNSGQQIPETFLRGQDPSVLHLRHLRLQCISLESISGLLLSATALTDLFLKVDTVFGSSPETSLLACLQSMLCLRRLDLFVSYDLFDPPPYPSTAKDIVPLSKLTCFHYFGHIEFLEALVAGLSAPSLLDVDIDFLFEPSIVHLPRFISEINEHYHAVHAAFQEWTFHLSFLTQSEYIGQCKPRFQLGSLDSYPEFLGICGTVNTKLTTVEELRVTFEKTSANKWENVIPWRRFLLQFPSVKALRTENADNCSIARCLLQDHEEADGDLDFLPALEEIELGKSSLSTDESQRGPELAAFQPFVSARQQAGRPVEAFFTRTTVTVDV
jgi:hypothetical protein